MGSLIAIGRADLRPENVPDELKTARIWVIWCAAQRKNSRGETKITKEPRSAHTGNLCSVTDSASLSTFGEARRALETYQADGIGCAFRDGHPLAGVDLDDCIDAEGNLHPSAAGLMRALSGYWEVSPSGQGVKGFIHAEGVSLASGTRLGDFPAPGITTEIYTSGRYFTITGHVHELSAAGSTLPEAAEQMLALVDRIEEEKAARKPAPVEAQRRESSPVDLSDQELLDVARRASNGAKFTALYDQGDYLGQGYPSQSEADSALCFRLAFYLGADAGRVDAAFRASALMRDKWDRSVGGGDTYGQETVSRACGMTREVYSPRRESAVEREGHRPPADSPRARLDARPRAKVYLDLEKSRESLDRALLELGDPPLFRKGSALLCFQGDGLYQPDSRGLGMELAKLVSFVKTKTVKSEDGDEEEKSIPCYPPTTLTAGMLGAPHLFQAVRPLRRLVTAPRILSDGSITEEGGYYPSSGLFYIPRVRMGALDLSLAKIKRILEEPFLDFPFEDASDFANALAIPLSIACAELYRGLSPVAVPRAPRYGSGKTKVVTVGVMLVTGAPPVTIDYEPGDSFTKEITSTLLTSPSAILIDNINETLDSPRFAAIMTSETTHARLLGGNQMATLENTCFWAATGNNIELTGEMIRRAFLIRLNPDVENPEERRNFRIADLDTWAKQPRNQSRYVSACLALAKHWLSAGCPRFTERVSGSFRDWAEVVGGMLGMLGHSEFLANREDFRATADPEQEMWRDVVGEWWRAFGVREITSKDVLDVITLKDVSRDETDHRNHREQPLMPLGNGLPQSKLTRLGMLLKKRVGQVFALPPGLGTAPDVKITAVGGNLSRSRYYLRPITPDRPPTDDQSGKQNGLSEKRSTRSTRSTSEEEKLGNKPFLKGEPLIETRSEGPLGPLSSVDNPDPPCDGDDFANILELPL